MREIDERDNDRETTGTSYNRGNSEYIFERTTTE